MFKTGRKKASRIVGRVTKSLTIGAMMVSVSGGVALSQSNEPTKIVFGEISPGTIHTPLYVAMDGGFFKKAGLDVEVQVLSGGTPAAMASMASGSVNMMMAGSTEFSEYLSKKVISGKVVGQMQDSAFDLIVSNDIESVDQIKGKIIGVSHFHAGDMNYMMALLNHFGIVEADVQIITTGNPINRLTALSAGAVQAIVVSNSQRHTSEKSGKVLIKAGESPVHVPNSMIFANADMVANHGDEVRKFLKALGDASVWIRANPDSAAPICAKSSGATVEQCLNSFKAVSDPEIGGKYTWSATHGIDKEGMATALAVVATYVEQAKGLSVDDVVDMSFAESVP